MADIFNSRPGVVAIISDSSGGVLPGRIFVEGFKPQAALISGIEYNQQTSQQFQTSLDQAIYLYVFGDAMGDIVVNGLAFLGVCKGDGEGLLEVFEFYEQNRASKRPEPVKVHVGKSKPIVGFLTGLKLRQTTVGDDPIGFLANFSLIINALPRE